MNKYYLNDNMQHNGDYEVHEEACKYLPHPENRIYLGEFSNCAAAVKAAANFHDQVNGCKNCATVCHSQ